MEILNLLLLLSFLLSLYLFFLLKFTKKSTPNLPPGPRKLPLIGNIHNLIGAAPHRALYHLALKHGPLIHIRLGELSVVVVSSPECARQVMKTHDANFASRPPLIASEIMSYGQTSITFSPYGDYWRQLRKICTLELLSAKRVQSFRSLREKVFSDFMKSIASNDGSPVNLTEKLYSATCAVTTRAALGEKTKAQERLLEIIVEAMDLGAGFDVADLFPSIQLLQKTSRMRKTLVKLHHEADTILEEIIHSHKAANATRMTDGENHEQEDLVDVLLKFQDESHEVPLTMDNIKSVILDVLGAGSETSTTAMEWAMAEMLRNPGILERAQNEVRTVCDGKGFVDESSVQELKYLKSVVKETLRMHPPGPLLLPRKCDVASEINGYEIPVDTKVIVNAWAINRDPKYWEEPDCFKPERFLHNSVDYRGTHFEYIPFGAGRRMCPGINFGLATIEPLVAKLLYHFDWSLPNSMDHEKMDMTEQFGVTIRRAHELHVIPVIRRQLPVV